MEYSNPPERVQECLEPGETLLWWGSPDPKIRFTAERLSMIFVAVLWAVYLILWGILLYCVSSDIALFPAFPYLVIFLTPFAIFLTMLYFSWRKRKSKTVFVITDRRVMDLFLERKETMMLQKPLATLTHFEVCRMENGGNIHLGKYRYLFFGSRYNYANRTKEKAHTGNSYIKNFQAYFNELDYLTFFDLKDTDTPAEIIRKYSGAEEHVDTHLHAY